MSTEELIYHSAIIWAIFNFGAMCLLIYLYVKTKRACFALYAIASFFKCLWGFSIPGISIASVKIFNGVFLPAVAGFFIFSGAFAMFLEYRRSRKNSK